MIAVAPRWPRLVYLAVVVASTATAADGVRPEQRCIVRPNAAAVRLRVEDVDPPLTQLGLEEDFVQLRAEQRLRSAGLEPRFPMENRGCTLHVRLSTTAGVRTSSVLVSFQAAATDAAPAFQTQVSVPLATDSSRDAQLAAISRLLAAVDLAVDRFAAFYVPAIRVPN
jgi:hypothetical protein